MGSPETKAESFKDKARHELIEYGINVAYLTVVFATFTIYRRLVLAAHDITYAHYGLALIEAVVLGKVIMIGSIFRLGSGLEARPLIYPTLYKTAVFVVFCAVFKFFEAGIEGLITGPGFMGGVNALLTEGADELIARCLMVFVAFVPYFAVKELGRVFGEKAIRTALFKERAEQ